jgi:ABC-type polysaccharide/polyol phosphate transport system ATPase subunit
MRTAGVAGAFCGSSTQSEVLLSVRGASRKFCRDLNRSLRYSTFDAIQNLFARRPKSAILRPDEFWALRNVSFEVRRGESVGVMGLNGAGKSTLLKLILGSLRLTEGQIVTTGRLAALSEHGLGFDPLLSGRENVYLTAAVLEISRRTVDAAFDQIVAFAGLKEFIDSPVRIYSTGMRARLGFSVAMHLEPDILLVDEVLAVGDIGFQRQCIQYAQQYLEGGGSLVLVSHNPHLVQFICGRCIVLDHGVVVCDGPVVDGVAQYLKATRTAADDPLALDASLAGGSAQFQSPSETSGVHIDDFGVGPIGAESLHTGDPARVYVRYRSIRDVAIRWGFCLLTSDLDTTITCEGLLEPFPIVAGAGELAGLVPRLPLTGGRYALRVAIMDPHSELPFALGGFHTPFYFTVEAPTTVRNNYRMFTRDLVALEDLKWERISFGAADAASSR